MPWSAPQSGHRRSGRRNGQRGRAGAGLWRCVRQASHLRSTPYQIVRTDVVERANVRVIEGGDGAGLAREPVAELPEQTLIATWRSSRVSKARNTSPIPPFPRTHPISSRRPERSARRAVRPRVARTPVPDPCSSTARRGGADRHGSRKHPLRERCALVRSALPRGAIQVLDASPTTPRPWDRFIVAYRRLPWKPLRPAAYGLILFAVPMKHNTPRDAGLAIPVAAAPIRVMLLDGQSGGPYHDWRATTPVMNSNSNRRACSRSTS